MVRDTDRAGLYALALRTKTGEEEWRLAAVRRHPAESDLARMSASRLRELYPTTATLELLSSPGVRIAATAAGDTRPISYLGGIHPASGPAVGSVEYVPLDVFVTPASPRRLVTSGLGGVFPPNLTIGYMTRVEPSSDGLFKSGDVRIDSALSSLDEVTVLVPEPSPAAR